LKQQVYIHLCNKSPSAIAVAIAAALQRVCVRTTENRCQRWLQRFRYSGGYSGSALVVTKEAILNTMSLLFVKHPSRLSFKNEQILNHILSTNHTTSIPKTNSIIFSLKQLP